MHYGDYLRAKRLERGWTQAELSAQSGVPLGTIRQLEQNRRGPLLTTARKLAAALSTPLDDFPDAK